MEKIALVIFVLTYIGVAVGFIPGLALDRTGIALLGAIAMVVAGVIDPHHAIAAIDMPTILLLYALMVVAAQFRLSGFYTATALVMTRFLKRPAVFLGMLMMVVAVLSAVLTNDIICLAFTPVLCATLIEAHLNPVPFLLGLACASNIGSALTIIGNPQNMLIGQVGRLSFSQFTAFCTIPAVVSLIAAYLLIALLYRNRFVLVRLPDILERRHDWPRYNHRQAVKGLIVTGLLLGMFFTPVPREVSSLAAAGVLLCSRKMRTRSMLGLVDWHLITLFCALFIVIASIERVGIPDNLMGGLWRLGIQLHHPASLTFITAALSTMVSNVPATILLVKFLSTNDPMQWYIVGLAGTFAGNLITIGSIANLIVIEAAQPYGIHIGFKEHARVGIPVTMISFMVLLGWIGVNR
ncbi:MAG: anion transporter [Desulfobacterota bacterium]|nr:anion transporter [Thermodesulfobacteriota bacterium]